MRSGGLRHRVAIEQDVGGIDTSVGGRVENWQTVFETRARIAHQSGREFRAAQQTTAAIAALMVIRFTNKTDIESLYSMRIRLIDKGRIYRIAYAFDPTERGREIHIHAVDAHRNNASNP